MNIKPEDQAFTGERISIYRILDKEIVVSKYKIEPSKFTDKGNGKRLKLQIKFGEKDHIIFTGSGVLMDLIEKVDKESFPFATTIIENNKRLEFT